MSKPTRYLLVWDRMGDYHVARWRALQAAIGAENTYAGDLCGADQLYGWETAWSHDPQYRLLSQTSASQQDIAGRLSSFQKLVKEGSITHVALAGYGRPEYLLMAIWAKATGRQVTLFAESWYPASSPWKDWLKGKLVSGLAHRFFVSGVRAAHHFQVNLKIPASRIAIGYSVVDNAHFGQAIDKVQTEKSILCVARFAPEKNLERLIEAFAASSLPQRGFMLKLVGGGPLAETLKEKASQYPWLVLQNWVGYAELPDLYASAQAFILPSLFEPWGLVVNEALAANLPVAASTAVGALPDLLGDPYPLSFDPEKVAEITAVLEKLADQPKAASAKLTHFTPESWVSTLLASGQQP